MAKAASWLDGMPDGIKKGSTGITYELTLNGGGTKYYIKGDALQRLLAAWFATPPHPRATMRINLAATQGPHTAGYTGHGYGYLCVDFNEVSSIAFFEMVTPKAPANPPTPAPARPRKGRV